MLRNASMLLDSRKRADQIRDHLLDHIRNGSLRGGEKLPTESEMTDMFGVGRSSIRAAIQSLSGLGIVEVRQGQGTYVRDLDASSIARLVADMLDLLPSVALQLWEARVLLEVGACRLAARRRTNEDIQAMSEAVERYRIAGYGDNPDLFLDADVEFHTALVKATHNDVLVAMLEAVSDRFRQTRPRQSMSPEITRSAIREHQQILAAIESSDSEEAARLTEEFLMIVEPLHVDPGVCDSANGEDASDTLDR